MPKVQFSNENIKRCICPTCPVQRASACVKEKMKKLKGSPSTEEMPGMYCSSGLASCDDIDTEQMCICGECPVWEDNDLLDLEPLGYYCRDGNAKG
jgi:hypothetical protein